MITSFTIYGEPRSKKNSQNIVYNKRLKRPMIIQNEKYKEYEEATLPQLPKVFINMPCCVKATFYRSSKRRVDKSNLEAALHDVLVKGGVLADDCRDIIASTDGSRVYYDKENPRTEVEISLMEEEYLQWKEW